jgi:hypothetical protein
MIVYHKNDEIDRDLWDNCISNSSVTKPYPYSWFLDRMAPGWEALIDDDYDSVFPLPSYVTMGTKYSVPPAFLQQLGAFSPDKPASSVILEFLDFMPQLFRLTDLSIGQKISYRGYKITEKQNYVINLSYSYEKLVERFTPECKQHIASTIKLKYRISEDITPDELTEMFVSDRRTNRRKITARDLARLKDLMEYCTGNGKGRIVGVRNAHEKPEYGIFMIVIKGSVTLIFEAESKTSISDHTGFFLINKLIREYSSSNIVLDFAGISDNSPVNKGVLFGGMNIPYYRLYRNRLFYPVRILR